ncbi:type II toxin-antitoxin system ParD family antitoxin [Methylobacterium durans]|uniref:Uncharacterized protein n=1 Tax=Methylobacterium durans TaxID=2202825 RepID=A0A2U8WBR0_9HYPH|nr:type II toxin-antitoxin system ParD family antitoxin [Methylobacterium durans]AWN43594.1 hypothetical protein DK389_27675 [Methylobacterium durans]
MSLRQNVSISLSPERHAAAERMLPTGRGGASSGVLRAGLRRLDARDIDVQQHRSVRQMDGAAAEEQPGA